MRRFRVAALVSARLDPAAAHHLLHVLRHPIGAPLVLFDGAGREVEAVLADGDGAVEVRGVPRERAPRHALHLLLALPKGDALPTALRMAVEVGFTHVHPVLSRRTVPKGDHADRWERILASGAQQCGRADVPSLSPLRPLAQAAGALPPGLARFVALPDAERVARPPGPAAVAVGPEGGFAPEEVSALLATGFAPIGLGAWVLRVDTAVAVAGAALAAE